MSEQEDMKKLQLFEQSLQNILMQKKQFQTQQIEVNSALKELSAGEDSYKIIGNIMVRSDPKALTAELEEKKRMLDLRIKNLEKQEKDIKDKSKKIQGKILEK